MNLFQLGSFVLASKVKSNWKIECNSLTYKDWECIAALISDLVEPFSSVTGVPTGGYTLGECLEGYTQSQAARHLIVDDVLSTGGSMERVRQKEIAQPHYTANGEPIIGAVLFARGKCPEWVQAVFQIHKTLMVI